MRTDLSATSGQPAVTPPSTKSPLAQPGVAPQRAAPVDRQPAAAAPGNPDRLRVDTATDEGQRIDQATLRQSVDDLNRFVQPREGSIEFTLDQSSGKALLQVVDTQTRAVLLQVPSEQALALSQSIGQTTGQLIKDSA